MTIHWEWGLLVFVVGILTVYVLAYQWLLWRGARHIPPIYGPADPYRLTGSRSRPNARMRACATVVHPPSAGTRERRRS